MNLKKLYTLYISVAFFYFWPIIKADPIIQLTLLEDEYELVARMKKKIETKGTVGHTGFNHLIQASPLAGFFATYAGMLALSDTMGTIIFPRRHTQSVVYLAITENIIPIIRIDNTVHHWEFDRKKAVLFFRIEPKIDKEENRLIWDIQEAEVPVNYIIPAEAMILFGDPIYFYFDTKTKYSAYVTPNIFLPPLIIRKGTNAIKSSLHLLSIRHFFGSLQPLSKHEAKTYRLMVQP